MASRTYSNTSLSRNTNKMEKPIVGRESEMKKNDAGGYSFISSDWLVLQNFLILGTEGGSFYVQEQKLTDRAATIVNKCVAADGNRVLDMISTISTNGRAVRNTPALFALAVCASSKDETIKRRAMSLLKDVARTGTHLLNFFAYIKSMRGSGRVIRTGIANWFHSLSSSDLSFQLTKYKNRDGWSWADVLRLSHVKSSNSGELVMFKNALGKLTEQEKDMYLYGAARAEWELAKCESTMAVVKLINGDTYVTHEMIPTIYKKSPDVWAALLSKGMGVTAMIRNLGNMTSYGVFQNPDNLDIVLKTLTSKEAIKKSRVHPLAIAMAMRTYDLGHGLKGDNSWNPIRKIVDALDTAFVYAFDNVVPTGKRIYLACDVSGSMTWPIAGMEYFKSSEASAMLAMLFARVEKNSVVRGFSTKMVDLGITKNDSLLAAARKTAGMTFGGTNCSTPFIDAMNRGEDFDAFIVISDGDDWHGSNFPSQAKEQYEKKVGHPVKFIAVSTKVTTTQITDPKDPNQITMVGFDTVIPQAISAFISDSE
jgi:60 kDa SS-A/Ro ribonucleoprotein